jgi:copper(I)-binding protein
LAPGASHQFLVATNVAPVPSPPISTTATVTSATSDPDLSNNTVTIEGSTSPQVTDLQVTAAFPAAEVVPGTSASAVFDITNNGPAPTTITPIRLTMPAGFVLTSVNNGGACNTTADPTSVVCDIGQILVGDTIALVATFDVDATISDTPTPTVTAEAIDSMSPDTAAPPVVIDTDPTNNSASIDYSLLRIADLAISGTAPELFAAGPGIQWHFTVDNLGPSTTGSIDLHLLAPPGAVLTDATELYPGHGARPTWGGPVLCDADLHCDLVAPLAAGESFDITLTFDMTGVAEGPVNLTGDVSSSITDPELTNNTVTLSSGAVTAPVVPLGPDPSGELPYTGNNSTVPLLTGGLWLTVLGLMLLGTSTAAIHIHRRRR